MHPELERRFEDLERRRIALVERVRALPPERQHRKPGRGLFSAAEVVMHFVLVERANLKFFDRNPPSALRGQKPRVTFIFRKVVQAMSNPKRPLPSAGYQIPRERVDVEDAAQQWSDVRTRMRAYLEQIESPSDAGCRLQFFFGLASGSDYLDLIEAHMHYHEVRFPDVKSGEG